MGFCLALTAKMINRILSSQFIPHEADSYFAEVFEQRLFPSLNFTKAYYHTSFLPNLIQNLSSNPDFFIESSSNLEIEVYYKGYDDCIFIEIYSNHISIIITDEVPLSEQETLYESLAQSITSLL